MSATKHSALITWLVYLIAAVQRKHYISDAAIAGILKILSLFFVVLGRMYPQFFDIADTFPTTLYRLHGFLGTKSASIIRYVCCPNCHEVYHYSDCIKLCGTKQTSEKCTRKTGLRTCGTLLLKPIQSTTGRLVLCPIKTYCYMPIKNSLQQLLNRPGFQESCESWRTRNVTEGVMSDVYDGNIWKEFQQFKGKPFLSQPFTYGLMLNIDWFKPYKHLEYSVGAIYLTIMNLPRQVRFKQENVMLVGLIPGPKEPSLTINSFLRPLIDELLSFFNGVQMSIPVGGSILVRCALLCVACDIPACRKVTGFLGHSATLGCSKCLKKFPGSVGNKDYSGFDTSQWPSRHNTQHRNDVNRINVCKTKAKKKELESLLGCRYSVLLDLPYFDPIRMAIIDPMHNLYLGTAKHILKKVWHERNMIDKKDYVSLQECVDSVCVPSNLGRLPSKILSSFSGLTADQLKNWTNIFSLFALHSHLSSDDFECWRHFILASRILTQMQLSTNDVELAHVLLLQFCRRVQRMYGLAHQ